MERSWWIVLVLICNLAYGQINSGAIGNNRFLQRTNPQITRALNDGGSSLDHPEVQKLARQMVDLGIWGNLTMWMHDALVNRRQSGSDFFATKLYNIQTTNIVASQTSTTLQPQLVTLGIKFDGSNDFMTIPHSEGINNFTQATNYTICFYVKGYPLTLFEHTLMEKWSGAGFPYSIRYYSGGGSNVALCTSAYNGSQGTGGQCSIFPVNTWRMITFVYSWSTNQLLAYDNANVDQSGTCNLAGTISNTASVNIGRRFNGSQFFPGEINDIRIFNTALTAAQINAIFQETRGKYGI